MTEAEAMKVLGEWAKVLGSDFSAKNKEDEQIEKQEKLFHEQVRKAHEKLMKEWESGEEQFCSYLKELTFRYLVNEKGEVTGVRIFIEWLGLTGMVYIDTEEGGFVTGLWTELFRPIHIAPQDDIIDFIKKYYSKKFKEEFGGK